MATIPDPLASAKPESPDDKLATATGTSTPIVARDFAYSPEDPRHNLPPPVALDHPFDIPPNIPHNFPSTLMSPSTKSPATPSGSMPQTASPECITPAASPGRQHQLYRKTRAKHLFSPEAANELGMIEGEPVTIIELSGDDWVKVCNARGEVGLVPVSFLE